MYESMKTRQTFRVIAAFVVGVIVLTGLLTNQRYRSGAAGQEAESATSEATTDSEGTSLDQRLSAAIPAFARDFDESIDTPPRFDIPPPGTVEWRVEQARFVGGTADRDLWASQCGIDLCFMSLDEGGLSLASVSREAFLRGGYAETATTEYEDRAEVAVFGLLPNPRDATVTLRIGDEVLQTVEAVGGIYELEAVVSLVNGLLNGEADWVLVSEFEGGTTTVIELPPVVLPS